MNHPLHRKIADIIEKTVTGLESVNVIKDMACCQEGEAGIQQIPLFCKEQKSRGTRYCCVDLLILQKDKIRGIIEIEEADIKPTQICGKFLTSALSEAYIHEQGNGSVPMADTVFFIQVLDSSKLKDRTAKMSQFRNLEQSIQRILPLAGSRVNRYKLYSGKLDDDFPGLGDFIRAELQY